MYGFLWRNFGGLYGATGKDGGSFVGGTDQIARLLRDLKDNPNSRRHIVTGWDLRECDRVALPPCHTLYQFKVHNDGGLSYHHSARSIDSFLDLPFNVASYALLTHLIAHVTERSPRELMISFGDLHIYKNHLTHVETLLARKPHPLPDLKIDDWHGQFKGLEGLLASRAELVRVHDYISHPKIEAPVAV